MEKSRLRSALFVFVEDLWKFDGAKGGVEAFLEGLVVEVFIT